MNAKRKQNEKGKALKSVKYLQKSKLGTFIQRRIMNR